MKQRVLFLCTGNSARSQMAEALLRNIAGDRYATFSAGTAPAGLNPLAVAVMKELDIDISNQQSKRVERFIGESFDYVVTVCDRAKESCPTFPSARRLVHWTFDDPAAATGSEEDRLLFFRRVRDEIKDHLRQFVIEEKSKNVKREA
jgi:arsenate reductase (thioredoxin)